MTKFLSVALTVTLFAFGAFAQDAKPEEKPKNTVSDGNGQASFGFGTVGGSATKNAGYATEFQGHGFMDANGQGPLFFGNGSVAWSISPHSDLEHTSSGIHGNGDVFVGWRFDGPDYRSSAKDTMTMYMGGAAGYHGNAQSRSGIANAQDFNAGPEAGLFILKNNHVITFAPTVVFSAAGATFNNADGSPADKGTYLDGKDVKTLNRVGSDAGIGVGWRARYVYADKVYALAEYLNTTGDSNQRGSLSETNYQGNIYNRFYTMGRVKVTPKISVGGNFRYVEFQSVDGSPLMVKQLSATVTRIF